MHGCAHVLESGFIHTRMYTYTLFHSRSYMYMHAHMAGVHLEIATHYMMVFILNEVSTPFVNNNTLMAMCHTSPYAQDVRREKARKSSGMNHDSSDDDGRDLARKEAEKEKGREEAEMHWVYHNHNIKDPSDVPVSAARAVCSPRSLHSLHSLLGSLLYSPLYSMLLSLLSSLLCSFNSLLRWPQLHLLKQSVIYKVNAVAVLIFFTISRVIMNVLLVDHIWRQTLFAHWDRLYAMGACTCISAHFLCLLALAHTCVNLVRSCVNARQHCTYIYASLA